MALLMIGCTMFLTMVIHAYVYPLKQDVDLLRKEFVNDNELCDKDVARHF